MVIFKKDNFIYGFDIISLYNLIIKSGKKVQNPYNRNEMPKDVMQNIRHLIRLSKILKIPIDIDIKDINDERNGWWSTYIVEESDTLLKFVLKPVKAKTN